jgi:hypothetical protein
MNAFDKFVEEFINIENYRSSESTNYSNNDSGNTNTIKNTNTKTNTITNHNQNKNQNPDEIGAESVRNKHNHKYKYKYNNNNNNICLSQLLFISQMHIKGLSKHKSNNNNRSLLFNENLKEPSLLCFSSVPSSVKVKLSDSDARKHKFKLNINKNKNISINKLVYVRYADDFLLGVRGSYQDCVDLLNKITLFLKEELNLNLSAENTIITNANKGKAYFIGTSISKPTPKPRPTSKPTPKAKAPLQSFQRSLVIRQSIPISIRLEAPLDKISHKLREAKILKGIVPVPRFIWLPKSKDQIIALYNSFYNAYINFYSCVHNLGYISSYLHFVLKTSCAKLLAAKFKLKTQNKVFAKFGKDLLGTDKIAFVSPTPVYKYKDKYPHGGLGP